MPSSFISSVLARILVRKDEDMPQLSLHLEEECMGRLRIDAADAGLSLSK